MSHLHQEESMYAPDREQLVCICLFWALGLENYVGLLPIGCANSVERW